MQGRIPDRKEVEQLLRVDCRRGECRSCLYNNYGPRRQELGPGCGVAMIYYFIKEVAQNYGGPSSKLKKGKLNEDDFV